MSSLFSKKYADKYETNKYIWENETDKNSDRAKKAQRENQEIRNQLGITSDTMNYEEFKNARANHSDYYKMAENTTINPKYKQESDRLYEQINNFTYDAEDDPYYTAYANAAKRESKSAQKDTYAQMTKSSGGRNNSYASAATAQVGQAYSQKINDYAKQLAGQAYEKLVKKYELSVDRYNSEQKRVNDEYEKYIKLGDAEVESQRNTLKDQRESRESEIDYETKVIKYQAEADEYEAQLKKNKILNEKNEYEYRRWLEDPMYEIKDKKLAEAIGNSIAYNWLKENNRPYLYSKLYK